MEPADLLASMTPTIDPDEPTRASAVIADAWGLVYAQGGVVMAAMLRAAEEVLAREDLRLRACSAVFCRPVPCGPVTSDVDIVRNGRSGAQVEVRLTTAPGPAEAESRPANAGPNALATVVFAADDDAQPAHVGLALPEGLAVPPPDLPGDPGGIAGDDHGMNFLKQTNWKPASEQPEDELRRQVWFRFRSTPLLADGTWEPSALLVPGDALGFALPPDALASGNMSSVSLQISAEFLRPATGNWIGIDSTCFRAAGGTASGLTTLWDSTGELVASVTQTALLR